MNHLRGSLTAEIPRKRKERDREDSFLPPPLRGKQVQSPKTTSLKPVFSNRLLAGYMAHEFLTQGTLLGQKFNPAHSQAEPKKKPAPETPGAEKKSYAEVASLLKSEEAHIPGVVNPTQLARWIQM